MRPPGQTAVLGSAFLGFCLLATPDRAVCATPTGTPPGASPAPRPAIPAASASATSHQLRVVSGSVRWRPGGQGAWREAAGSLFLYPGDEIEVAPGAEATLASPGATPRALAAPGTHRVGGQGPEPGARAGDPSGGPSRTEARAASTPDREYFAQLRPVGGPSWIRPEGGHWLEVRGLTSLMPGTEVKVGASCRAEVAARGDYQLRAGPGALFTVLRRTAHLHSGRLAMQAERAGSQAVLTSPEAVARSVGGLLAAEAVEDEGTVFHAFQGLWRIENRPPEPELPHALYLPAGKHTRFGAPSAPPEVPLRFDTETTLSFFTENWDQDREPPPPVVPEDQEGDAAVREFREDQAPEPSEAPAETRREAEDAAKAGPRPMDAKDRTRWLRLKVLSSRSPTARRYYLDFRRAFADDPAHPLPPGQPARPRGYTEGASKRVLDEQEAWIVARNQQNLRRREVGTWNSDRERHDMARPEAERFLREHRETLFGFEPLPYQTRSLLGPTRQRVGDLLTRATAADQQARSLVGTPGFEAQVAQLFAERDALLREADRRKDQLEELIELH